MVWLMILASRQSKRGTTYYQPKRWKVPPATALSRARGPGRVKPAPIGSAPGHATYFQPPPNSARIPFNLLRRLAVDAEAAAHAAASAGTWPREHRQMHLQHFDQYGPLEAPLPIPNSGNSAPAGANDRKCRPYQPRANRPQSAPGASASSVYRLPGSEVLRGALNKYSLYEAATSTAGPTRSPARPVSAAPRMQSRDSPRVKWQRPQSASSRQPPSRGDPPRPHSASVHSPRQGWTHAAVDGDGEWGGRRSSPSPDGRVDDPELEGWLHQRSPSAPSARAAPRLTSRLASPLPPRDSGAQMAPVDAPITWHPGIPRPPTAVVEDYYFLSPEPGGMYRHENGPYHDGGGDRTYDDATPQPTSDMYKQLRSIAEQI